MAISVEDLWRMPDADLLQAYYEARRRHVEGKFARDSQRARLEWLRAKAFVAGSGGVTERQNGVAALDDLGRKGQELREATRELELLKADVDVIAMIIRLRSASFAEARIEEPCHSDEEEGLREEP